MPDDCYYNHHGQMICPSDLYRAFDHGRCFKADSTFLCEDDMDEILGTMCAEVGHYDICGEELYDLFRGDDIIMSDGHVIKSSFPSAHRADVHSDICRKHEGIEFCLEDIEDLYSVPHDCMMIAGEWLCQDTMLHAWKFGCVEVNHHRLCGTDMMDTVLQSCVEIDRDWVCPTAVGTRGGHY